MALFKILRGNSNRLPSTMTDGWAYFCTDTGEFFIDYKDEDNVLHRKSLSVEEAKKLTGVEGTENQLVSFDVDGNLIARNEKNIKTATIVVGTTLSNHTIDMCNILCDGEDDSVIVDALHDFHSMFVYDGIVPEIRFLDGIYNFNESFSLPFPAVVVGTGKTVFTGDVTVGGYDGVTFRNITFDNAKVYIDANYCSVIECSFMNYEYGALEIPYGEHIEIRNNFFKDCYSNVVNLIGACKTIVADNTFINCRECAIYNSNGAYENVISGNKFDVTEEYESETVQYICSAGSGAIITNNVMQVYNGEIDQAFQVDGIDESGVVANNFINGILYHAPTADQIAYDNTTSGLTATNVQDAIDEIDSTIDNLATKNGGDTLAWNGDTTGLVSVSFLGSDWYKVSDSTPTKTDCANGWTIVQSGSSVTMGATQVQEFFSNENLMIYQNGVLFIPSDNYVLNSDVTFPEAGTYFLKNADGVILESLTIPNYTGYASVIIRDSAISDNIQRKITGTAGQVVGFDANGNAVAMAAPSSLPEVTVADNGKFLCVVDDAWAVVSIPYAEEASF